MSMKAQISFLLAVIAAIGSFSLATASNQIPPEDIPLYPTQPPGNQPHVPCLSVISCFLSPNIMSLFFSSSIIAENATILIENTTTGDYNLDQVYISSIPSTQSLFGPGTYSITVTLSSGAVYYGSFSFNQT